VQATPLPQAERATVEADYTTVSFYSADQKYVKMICWLGRFCVRYIQE
jgi:hypothetical protein